MPDLTSEAERFKAAPNDAARAADAKWRSRVYLWTREAERGAEQAAALEREVGKLERELASLESSLSWRLTAPLRVVDHALRRMARRFSRTEKIGEFDWIDRLNFRRGGGRILADCSMTIRGKSSPGMRRVTAGLLKGSMSAEGALVPVDLLGGSMREAAESFAEGVPAGHGRAEWICDAFLMLDASWEYCEAMKHLSSKFREAGIPIWALVHDTVPLDHPELCLPEVVERFSKWIDMVFRCCDGVVCVSETTASRVRWHYERTGGLDRKLQIASWLPGSESMEPVTETEELVPPDDFFLCVGTLESRKNYRQLLDAMTDLWEAGRLENRLVIFGEKGWGIDDLVERMLGHPQWGNKLWWFEGGSDEHLRALYQSCKAFVLPSIDEGFSQPLSEVSRFQKPGVLSDIPIFRERVIRNGLFFDLRDMESLKQALIVAAGEVPAIEVAEATWTESAEKLCGLIAQHESPASNFNR